MGLKDREAGMKKLYNHITSGYDKPLCPIEVREL